MYVYVYVEMIEIKIEHNVESITYFITVLT